MSLEHSQSWQQVGLFDRPLMHFTGTLADNLLSARPAGHLLLRSAYVINLNILKMSRRYQVGMLSLNISKGYVHNLPTAPGLLVEGWLLTGRPSRFHFFHSYLLFL